MSPAKAEAACRLLGIYSRLQVDWYNATRGWGTKKYYHEALGCSERLTFLERSSCHLKQDVGKQIIAVLRRQSGKPCPNAFRLGMHVFFPSEKCHSEPLTPSPRSEQHHEMKRDGCPLFSDRRVVCRGHHMRGTGTVNV